MGWSASEVAGTSIWRLMAAYRGYRKANGIEDKPPPPTEEQWEAAWSANPDL